jgi:murein DD-endopeptidase MepM/ murein hydrolase activator NlpD
MRKLKVFNLPRDNRYSVPDDIRIMWFVRGLVLGIIAFIVTACEIPSTGLRFLSQEVQAMVSSTPVPSDTMPVSDITGTETPTAVVVLGADNGLAAENDSYWEQIPPSPAPDPLRFVFPDSGPAPVSAWRPPLYPIPWAPTPHDHFYFARPIAADEVNWPLADYRYGGIFFEDQVHTGVDFPAPEGTPVLAAAEGKVIWAGYGLYRGVQGDLSDPYGMAVVIKHNFGFQGKGLFTVYGHLQRVDVIRGQGVDAGEVLGLVGETGMVTGPHLHFEVRLGESDFFKTYNPELWLVPPQGWGVFVGRIMDTAGYLYMGEDILIQSLASGQYWRAKPYGGGAVNRDPYYQENVVISDLPAGRYEISTSYAGRFFVYEFQIDPGRVTYLAFQGREGFSPAVAPDQDEEHAWPEFTLTPTP